MIKKILVAVDGSETSLKAVEYVGDLLCGNENVEITLYHVLEIPIDPLVYRYGGLDYRLSGVALKGVLREESARSVREDREKTKKEILCSAEKILRQRCPKENGAAIQMKLAKGTHSDVAQKIIHEATSGGYSAIVLGRRGRSMLKEFVFGGVTSEVVHHIEECAVWIVE